MNRNYEHDKAAYPVSGFICLEEAWPVSIYRQDFRKQTERQSYTIRWYIVLQDGVEKGVWKSMHDARAQKDRLLNPKKKGARKLTPAELELFRITNTLTEEQNQRILEYAKKEAAKKRPKKP